MSEPPDEPANETLRAEAARLSSDPADVAEAQAVARLMGELRGGKIAADDESRREVFGEACTILADAGLSPTQVASWFTTRTGWLDDQAPTDLIDTEPQRVLDAAKHQSELPFY